MSILLPFTLSAILTTDPLGYECVPEEKLEAAYALGGKGLRVPQTCIPDPCDQTFSELTLAAYSGYQDETQYRDYRNRMSRVCGAPTVWDDIGITQEQLLRAVFDGGSGSIPLPAPILTDTAVVTGFPLFSGAFGGRSGGGGRIGGIGWIGNGIGVGGPVSIFAATKPSGKGTTETQPFEYEFEESAPEVPTHVPLPAPFFLLSAAAMALVLLKRLRRGARP